MYKKPLNLFTISVLSVDAPHLMTRDTKLLVLRSLRAKLASTLLSYKRATGLVGTTEVRFRNAVTVVVSVGHRAHSTMMGPVLCIKTTLVCQDGYVDCRRRPATSDQGLMAFKSLWSNQTWSLAEMITCTHSSPAAGQCMRP